MVDEKDIRRAVDTGKVAFGAGETAKACKGRSAKAVVLAANCRTATAEALKKACEAAGIPLRVFNGNGIELGAACGRPHTVSALAVLEAGTSKILEAGGA